MENQEPYSLQSNPNTLFPPGTPQRFQQFTQEWNAPRNRTEENLQKAKDLKALLNEVLEIVQTLAENNNMNEEQYRQLCEKFMKIYNIKLEPEQEYDITQIISEGFQRNAIVRSQTAIITNYQENQKKNHKTDEEKLKSGNYCICNKCGIVIRKSGKAEHQKTAKCWKGRDEKKLSASTGKAETPEEALAIMKIRSALRKKRNGNRFIEN